jgi:hypothetical protein
LTLSLEGAARLRLEGGSGRPRLNLNATPSCQGLESFLIDTATRQIKVHHCSRKGQPQLSVLTLSDRTRERLTTALATLRVKRFASPMTLCSTNSSAAVWLHFDHSHGNTESYVGANQIQDSAADCAKTSQVHGVFDDTAITRLVNELKPLAQGT